MPNPIGAALSALDKGGLKPINYLNSIHRMDKDLVPEFDAQSRDVFNTFWPQFQAENTATRNAIAALKPQSLADVTKLTSNLIGADPFAQYGGVLDRGLAAGERVTANLGDLTSSNAKSNIAALGGGGRPMGSAALARINQDVAASMLPIFNNIITGAGATTTGLSAAQRANAAGALQAIDYRTGIPLQGYGMALDPINALAAAQEGRLRGPRAVIGNEQANTVGWQSDPGTLGRIGGAISAADDAQMGQLMQFADMISKVGQGVGSAAKGIGGLALG